MSLLTTLLIIRNVMDGPTTTEALCDLTGLSDRQVKRRISEAQALGAEIHSEIRPGVGGQYWTWICDNVQELEKSGKLDRWIELETNRSVL